MNGTAAQGFMGNVRKVLIVDDDETICSLIRNVTNKHGAMPTVVHTGEGAKTALEGSCHFDVIFLDLILPHMSGWEILDLIKNNSQTKDTPVVILSGAPLLVEEKKRLSKEVVAFVEKETFSLAEFKKMVAELLE